MKIGDKVKVNHDMYKMYIGETGTIINVFGDNEIKWYKVQFGIRKTFIYTEDELELVK